jgi:hypothetical protein
MQRTSGTIKRLFSRESPYLPAILKAQLAFLVGLALVAIVLPLSWSEKWAVVVAAGVLAGLTWSTLNHVRRR